MSLEVKVRLCIKCQHKCNMQPPIVGCLSVYTPAGLEMVECTRRVWFDAYGKPVDFWRAPTLEEQQQLLSRTVFQARLKRELKLLQQKEAEQWLKRKNRA